mmetsp:Transcript_4371/g.12321  ORF Transcript_4371/g.12321 Transcript_4371/m.12321 type:complete len:271 (+) Transcript_4371:101-913(+)
MPDATDATSATTTSATPEELLPAFKTELGDAADGVSDENLLKFLRWKPSVERAAGRFRDHQKWRESNPFVFEDRPLQASKDDELKRILETDVVIAPEDFVSKKGSAVLRGRLRNNDMADGRTVEDVVRMVLFTMDRVLEWEHAQVHGITLFYDMKGVTSKNIHVGIPRLLLNAIIGHFPIRIAGAYILNAPFIFKGMFAMIQLAMPPKLRKRFHFVSSIDEVYEVIDKDLLLEEHGGKRIHESSEWVALQMQRESNGSVISLEECFDGAK